MASASAVTGEMLITAKAGEPDRYLAALLARSAVRDDLVVLAAFIAEIKRIPGIAADPHLAEIRLAWWRDALLSVEPDAAGHPTADAMRFLMARHGLDRDALAEWLEAFAHTFYAAPPEDAAHLDLELSLTEGTPFAFAARICGAEAGAALDAACGAAGIAYGLARLGLDFPRALARGRVPLPGLSDDDRDGTAVDAGRARDVLAQLAAPRLRNARALYAGLDAGAKTALLPLALVEPYLRASCAQGHDLTRELAEIAPLTRVWRLWRAHFSRRV